MQMLIKGGTKIDRCFPERSLERKFIQTHMMAFMASTEAKHGSKQEAVTQQLQQLVCKVLQDSNCAK